MLSFRAAAANRVRVLVTVPSRGMAKGAKKVTKASKKAMAAEATGGDLPKNDVAKLVRHHRCTFPRSPSSLASLAVEGGWRPAGRGTGPLLLLLLPPPPYHTEERHRLTDTWGMWDVD